MSNEKHKMIHVSVTLSDNAIQLLDKFACKKALSRSSVIRLLILESLDKKSGVIEN